MDNDGLVEDMKVDNVVGNVVVGNAVGNAVDSKVAVVAMVALEHLEEDSDELTKCRMTY